MIKNTEKHYKTAHSGTELVTLYLKFSMQNRRNIANHKQFRHLK